MHARPRCPARSRRRSSRTCPTTSPCRCADLPRAPPALQRVLVMVQLEVAERLAAPTGLQDLRGAQPQGRLVCRRAAARGRCAGPSSGRRRTSTPDWSRFTRREPPVTTATREEVFACIDAAFAQRRKTLRAALAGWAGSASGAEAAAAGRRRRPTHPRRAARHRRLRGDRRGQRPTAGPSCHRVSGDLSCDSATVGDRPRAGEGQPRAHGRPAARRRVPRRWPRSSRRWGSTTRSPSSPADDWSVVASTAPTPHRVPTDGTNLAMRAARLLAGRRASTSRVDLAHRQGHPGRRRDGGRLGRRRRRPRGLRRRSGDSGSPRRPARDWPPSWAATSRSRSPAAPRWAPVAESGSRRCSRAGLVPLGPRRQRRRALHPDGLRRVRPPARQGRVPPSPRVRRR